MTTSSGGSGSGAGGTGASASPGSVSARLALIFAILSAVLTSLDFAEVIRSPDPQQWLIAAILVTAAAGVLSFARYVQRARNSGSFGLNSTFVVSVISVLVALCSVVLAGASLLAPQWLPGLPAKVNFSQPGAVIEVGGDVSVAGSVSGLRGRTLWVVSTPEVGGRYYLTQEGPVAQSDGNWQLLDFQVGDDSDRGRTITYSAIVADRACQEFLLAVPVDVDGLQISPVLDSSCMVADTRTVRAQ